MQDLVATIGISVFREPVRYLEESICSALSQRSVAVEVIVRCDGPNSISEDGMRLLEQMAAKNKNLKIVYGKSNIGPYGSYSYIFSRAQGRYIAQLDADDIMHRDAIYRTVSELEKHSRSSFLYTDCIEIDSEGNAIRAGARQQTPYSEINSLVQFIPFHLRVIRRDAYRRVGGYDPTLRYAGDYDISLKLAEIGDVTYFPMKLYSYRRHYGNMSIRSKTETVAEAFLVAQRALCRRGLDHKYRLILNSNGTTSLRLRGK